MHGDYNKKFSVQAEGNKYVFKRDLNYVCHWAHMTLFRKQFQTDEAKQNEQSLSAALLCAGLLRRGMV